MDLTTIAKVTKGIGSFITSVGVGAVASNLISVTTPKDTKKIIKICIDVGSFVVSGMCAVAATNQFEELVDQVANTCKKWSSEETE